MPARDNTAIAAKLELAADLLELAEADRFRVLSYRKAASAIRAWPQQMEAIAAAGELTHLPGIGAKMAANIEQVIARGSFEALDEITARIPPSLADVMGVPGVGPKRAMRLNERLGVATLDDLAAALADGRVAALGGFGAKTAAKIAASLEAHQRHRARTPLAVALPAAEAFARDLAVSPAIERVEVAGSVRRREDTVGNIDLVVSAGSLMSASETVVGQPAVERVVSAEPARVIVELHDGMTVDVRIVAPESYGAALRYYTGSIAHNLQVGEVAAGRGVDVSREAPIAEECDVYGLLGMDCPAPEMRWGAGEVAAAVAHELPRLVTLANVRGDLQSHSTYTDGKTTLEANLAVASELGYEYLAATDHAYALRMVGGLDVADLERQWTEIDAINERSAAEGGPRILKGIELNIAEDGSLDYDDEVLARFDIVLASMHSGWDDTPATATARVLRAIEHPLVDIIAHPIGRVIGRRDPIPIDVEQMLAAAGETGTIMEINSYPDRLDLSAEHIRLARTYGVRFSLGTDAHSAEQLRYMSWGVGQARRGLVTADELLNAQPWGVARTWLKRRRVMGDR